MGDYLKKIWSYVQPSILGTTYQYFILFYFPIMFIVHSLFGTLDTRPVRQELPKLTQHIDPMLGVDGGPKLVQHWIDVSCLLGTVGIFLKKHRRQKIVHIYSEDALCRSCKMTLGRYHLYRLFDGHMTNMTDTTTRKSAHDIFTFDLHIWPTCSYWSQISHWSEISVWLANIWSDLWRQGWPDVSWLFMTLNDLIFLHIVPTASTRLLVIGCLTRGTLTNSI